MRLASPPPKQRSNTDDRAKKLATAQQRTAKPTRSSAADTERTATAAYRAMSDAEFYSTIFVPLSAIRDYPPARIWQAMQAYMARMQVLYPELYGFTGARSEFTTPESTVEALDWLDSMMAFPQRFEVYTAVMYVATCLVLGVAAWVKQHSGQKPYPLCYIPHLDRVNLLNSVLHRLARLALLQHKHPAVVEPGRAEPTYSDERKNKMTYDIIGNWKKYESYLHMLFKVPRIFPGVLPDDWLRHAREVCQMPSTSQSRQRVNAVVNRMTLLLEDAGYTPAVQAQALTAWQLPTPPEVTRRVLLAAQLKAICEMNGYSLNTNPSVDKNNKDG